MRWTGVRGGATVALLLATAVVGLGAGPAHAAATINVPAAQPTIQAGIDAAVNGDTVAVAAGIYHEHIDFKGKAIEVKSLAGPVSTTIDGDNTSVVVVFKTGETRASVLRGFTVTHGVIPTVGGPGLIAGAGIGIGNASPTIIGNVITDNDGSTHSGAGIGAVGAPLIQDNVIVGNHTGPLGAAGGIIAGGGAEIIGNRIENNVAGGGGGMILYGGTPVVRDNIIRGNHAGNYDGGGVTFNGPGTLFVDNLVEGNIADVRGGGVAWMDTGTTNVPVLLNNTIVGNQAPTGSAVAGLSGGAKLAGNVVVGASATSLVHCVGNAPQSTMFTFNDVHNGTASSPYAGCADPTGTGGNISADPLFVAPAASPADYHLQAGSPAIDAADNAAAGLPSTDLSGSPRVLDGNGDGSAVVDMGAYEAGTARTINVPATQPTIQAAIDGATYGDTVVVAPGAYHEHIDFKGKAIEVKSSAGPSVTTIDGDGTGIVVRFKTGETRASVLRGFTVTGGLQPPMENGFAGGGIRVQDASPTIAGNVVTANTGSGIGVLGGSPLIQDNVITANTTPYDGGGIWAGSSSEIVGNRIEDNAGDTAAGLVVFGTTVVRGNVIRGNQAVGSHGGGGGLTMYGGLAVGNLIADNTALVGGYAMGGGVLLQGSSIQLLQNTFAGNAAPTGSAIANIGVGGTISGNIFAGPAGTGVVHCGGNYATYFQFNDVFNGTASRFQDCGWDITGYFGNISADPLFMSATDRRLQAGSPAMDAGDPAVTGLPTTDLAGAPRVTDGNGDGLAVVDMGAYEAPAMAIVGSRYHPLQPSRILDTRFGMGGTGPLGSAATMNLQVTGAGGIPAAGVSAVVLNVTVTQPTAPSFLTAWPAGAPFPLAANLNFVAGQTVPNLVTVKVGAGGQVSLYNAAGATDIVVDVAGWYGEAGATAGSRFTSVVPSRVLDTRFGVGAPFALGAADSVDLQVTGMGGVPAAGVSAVILNVTVTQPTAPSFLTAWPTGSPFPLAANLNYVAGQTVPNLVVVKVGDGGKVSLYNAAGSTHVVADVAGWFGEDGVPGAAGYTSVVPSRILDTRFDPGRTALGPGSVLDLQVTGRGGIPAAGVSAVVLNVTVTQPTAPSFLTAWPTGDPFPLAANLNYVAGDTVPNLVVVKVGAGGLISLYNAAGSTHLVADVAGWFSA